MSKGNKEEQKWLLGESLNQYDRSLKEELGKVEKRNREQNHKISALINAFDDDYIKKEEENTNISLDYSKEGIVIVDDIKGNTLVNNVKDSNKELVLNGDIDTQGVNVTLEDTVDNGKVDVVLEGNTEVNLSKTKDPIMITHKFDDINSNNGKLQTTVNEVTTVNDSPGKVDVKEITGDTLVNHVSNGSEELILNGDIDTNGYSNVTLTEGIDSGKVDVVLEGNTMVNVCDQEEPVAITKSYTVETGNHIALQGEYDGKCRPNIYGNTLVNLWDINKLEISGDAKRAGGKITITTTATTVWSNFFSYGIEKIKPSTTYSIIVNITKNTFSSTDCVYISSDTNIENNYNKCPFGNLPIYGSKVGVFIYTRTTPEDLTSYSRLLRSYFNNFSKTEGQQMELQILVLEGDYTNKPIPDYFTGMKSSFEDKLVPENLYKFSSRDDFYSLNPKVTLDGEYIKMTANHDYQDAMLKPLATIKPSTTYTIIADVVENTLNSRLVITSNASDKKAQLCSPQSFQIEAGKTGIFTRVVTSRDDLDGYVRCLINYLDIVNTTGSIKYRIMVVEGDYTNYDFTDYDSTKAGKYKVDYKVTGKNKFNKDSSIINTVIDINNGSIITENKTEGQWYTSPTIDISNISNITISHKNDGYINASTGIRYLLMDENYNPKLYADCTYINYAQTLDVSKYKYMKISVLTRLFPLNTIQIEEGATATDYEPYKESIKTLYLNSPLLEGDTIEQSGNNIIHNHRYTSITNKDLIPTFISLDNNNYRTDTSCACLFNFKDKTYNKPKTIMYCDKLPYYANSWSTTSVDCAICGVNNDYDFSIRLPHSVTGITTQDTGSECMEKFKTWNDNNLINIVYELATPTQEIISSNDNLLLDSYTNGHLDVDTVAPIDKVEFYDTTFKLKYLYSSTSYTIQFESDNIGKIDYMYFRGSNNPSVSASIVKGLNKITLKTGDGTLGNYVQLSGIGFNASKIVVTPKVDNNFGYFKGMKSVGECEGNKIEILSRNKNLFDINRLTNSSSNITYFKKDKATGRVEITYKDNCAYPYVSYTLTDEEVNFIKGKKILIKENLVQCGSNINPLIQFYTTNEDKKALWLTDGAIVPTNTKTMKLQVHGHNNPSNENIVAGTTIYENIYIGVEEMGDTYIPHKQNKKEILLNEPLRGLPNGVKDKYVIIDGKWYIERNCGKVTFNGSEGWYFKTIEPSGKHSYTIDNSMINGTNDYKHQGICDKLPFIYWNNSPWDSNYNCISTINKKVVIYTDFVTVSEFNSWLQNNPITVIYQLQTPTYEQIDYNPFEVYTDTTHISNNSTIPCNMVIKNSGYNTISLKENTKYTAYVNNKNNVSLTYKIDNNAIAVNSSNKFTFTTPSTLVDKTIRIASKGNKIENLMIIEGTPQNDPIGYFDGLKSSYECEKVTDVNDENFGKYKVDAKVVGKNLFGGYINDFNNYTINGGVYKALKLNLKKGVVYTLNPIEASIKGNYFLLCDNPNPNIAGATWNGICYDGDKQPKYTFTYSKDLYLCYFNVNGTTIDNFNKCINSIKVQLEEGNQATEYEPYFESTQTVYLNSPLLKGDKIIWKDNKLQHYHKMKTIVFDGHDGESWSIIDGEYAPSNTDYTIFYMENNCKLSSTVYCDKIPTSINKYITGSSPNSFAIGSHTTVKSIRICIEKSKLSSVDTAGLKQWLQQNPITVVYELETPYYEEISEYPLKFSSIANCSLSTTSNIQVSNISFNIYEETLPYLYNDKKYYITFNSDISKEIIINLGGSELIYTTKVGFNKVEITTPSNSNNMLTFNGQGVNINNVKVTQQNIDSYFEGMKSVGECEELKIISNNNDNTLSNKQTMTHEPLRGLPNGVKDKYVIIDGKWYIERNTTKVVLDGDDSEKWGIASWGQINSNAYFIKREYYPNSKSSIAVVDKFPCVEEGKMGDIDTPNICGTTQTALIAIRVDKNTSLDNFKSWLQSNPTTVIYQLKTPTYEPIDYNPFEVYTDTTHISNNSLIPANMVIKNTGYNCILKPNTKYTVVTNTQGSISAKIGSTKVDSTSNVFTIITPSTLTDSVLRFSGKGLTTKDIMLLEGDKTNYIPKYFTGMESAFEQEYDEEKNKYKVDVKVTDGNKENNITFYINEPLRGVGDVKDKVYVKEDKVVVERNCSSITFDGSESWLIDNSSSKYIEFNNKIITRYSPLKCNLYLWQLYGETERICCTIYGIYIKINKAKLQTQDVAGFKQWLQQNPVIVVYRLATPVYEEVECDLSKLMLENYENSSLILNSNIPPTVDVRYKGEVPIVSATKELSSNVESTTTDINENIIPYMCDMDYRIVELQLKNASTQGLEVNVLGLDSEDVLFNNRKANKIFNPSYEMLKRDILSKRYSTDEYKYRLERYLLANKISNEEYNELEELINNGR